METFSHFEGVCNSFASCIRYFWHRNHSSGGASTLSMATWHWALRFLMPLISSGFCHWQWGSLNWSATTRSRWRRFTVSLLWVLEYLYIRYVGFPIHAWSPDRRQGSLPLVTFYKHPWDLTSHHKNLAADVSLNGVDSCKLRVHGYSFVKLWLSEHMEAAPDMMLEWKIDDCFGQLGGILQGLSDHFSGTVKKYLESLSKSTLEGRPLYKWSKVESSSRTSWSKSAVAGHAWDVAYSQALSSLMTHSLVQFFIGTSSSESSLSGKSAQQLGGRICLRD